MKLTAELSKPMQLKTHIRLTRYNYVGYVRARIIELLYERGPLNIHQIAWELGLTEPTVRNHVMALIAGGYVCDKLIDQRNPKMKIYTVCPSCPLKDECEYKGEMRWSE